MDKLLWDKMTDTKCDASMALMQADLCAWCSGGQKGLMSQKYIMSLDLTIPLVSPQS